MDTHHTPAGLEDDPGTTREMLTAILDQSRQTFDLVKELLAKIMAQQTQIITIGKMTQADLDRLGKSLPDAVVGAMNERRRLPS
jgi:hypothetical protein